MTNGSRDTVERLQEQVTRGARRAWTAAVAVQDPDRAPKRRDRFPRLHPEAEEQRGGSKWYCATMISDKSFKTIKQTLRNLIPRRSPRRLADGIREVNATLRGWTCYFRHALAGRRFSFLRYLLWNRIMSWQRELHRWNWTQVKRWLRRPDGSWRTITADGIILVESPLR